MSQERLGDALNITFQQVQKYERGVLSSQGVRKNVLVNGIAPGVVRTPLKASTIPDSVKTLNSPPARAFRRPSGTRLADRLAVYAGGVLHVGRDHRC
jgi:NAD(P)-dependent dehydrogenase (short-subunit alcohol dehydrogenase family)